MNHSVSLWEEDEAAYMGFATQMLESGDFVNVEYQWSTIHRKTPFHFWTIALSFSIFGVNEFALRIPSALAIFLTCLLVYRLGRNLFGEKTACRAAVILATSIQLPLLGKIALTDATLLLSETLAVLSLLNFLYKPCWKYNLGLWAGISVGIMVKGPPVILLTGGLWLLLAIFHPLRKNLIKTHPWFWGLVALIPFAYWSYLSWVQDYALWQQTQTGIPFEEWWEEELYAKKIHLLPFLWDWYIMKRINGSVLGQTGFIGYHFVVLTIAFVTWLPFWFSTIAATIKNLYKPNEKHLMLILWVIMAWFFWEFMSSKLPSYSIAVQPALALLMAIQITAFEKQERNKILLHAGLVLYSIIFTVIIFGLPFLLCFDTDNSHFPEAIIFLSSSIQDILGEVPLYYILPMSAILAFLLIKILLQREQIESLYKNLALFGLAFMFLIWSFISPLIEQSAVKPFDDLINTAYKLSNNNRKTKAIIAGIDNKQKKISLWTYATNIFNEVEYMDFYNSLNALTGKEPVVLILGTDCIKKMGDAYRVRGLKFNPVEVTHRSTDDSFKEHNYWIFTNAVKE